MFWNGWLPLKCMVLLHVCPELYVFVNVSFFFFLLATNRNTPVLGTEIKGLLTHLKEFLMMQKSFIFSTRSHMAKANRKKGLHKHQHYNTLWKWSLKPSLRCPASPGASDLVLRSSRSAPEHPMSSCHHAGFMDEGSKECRQSMGATAGIPVTLMWTSPVGKKN